jgi:isopenicillin N synthase-like dioxygenase
MVTYSAPTRIEIPVIDISSTFGGSRSARRSVAGAIRLACETSGFFYISGHRMSADLIERQFAEAAAFFAKPAAEKMTCHIKLAPTLRGYEPPGVQALDPDSPADLKESFSIGIERGPEHPLVLAKIPRHGTNLWPADVDEFKQTSEAYFAAVLDLGAHVMGLIAESLDLPEGYFDEYFVEPNATLRMLRYPPHPAGAAANQLGCGCHTDWGAITLLAQDECGGLEVQTAAGQWARAEPINGTFVVNIGDLLARWTNDLYKSTPHRVLNNVSGRDRYSMATFYDPAYLARIECLPSCLSDGALPLHEPCTAGEHNQQMYFQSRGLAYDGMTG